LVNHELAAPDPVSVQVSYGAVGFGNVGELLEAVKRADADMYARKRERAALKRRMDFGIIAGTEQKRSPHPADPAGRSGRRPRLRARARCHAMLSDDCLEAATR
jgi:hypothetical protein